MTADSLWVLPTTPGTVIAIGDWWLVRLPGYGGSQSHAWELLPAENEEVNGSMERAGAKAQCVYSDDWVLAEAEQEGGYYVISDPVANPYGPTIRRKEARA